MDNTRTVSIVTVCYNSENTIEETIRSVINQSYQAIEYIVIDGKSTDETIKIVEKYNDKIAAVVSEPDKGIYDAMNKALDIAKGDWIYFLGSDDVLSGSTVIEEMVGVMVDLNKIYYGNVIFKNLKTIYKFEITKWHLCLRNISHQSIFYPANCYKRFRYNLKYKVFADHVYNISIFASKLFNFQRIDKVIAIYNDNGTSARVWDAEYFEDLPQIVYQNLGTRYAIYVKVRLCYFLLKRYLGLK